MATYNNYAGNAANTVSWSLAMSPDAAYPLDARSLFYSKASADAAALTAKPAGGSGTQFYIGQILTVYENSIVSHYSIQEDLTLKEVGAAVVGDNASIVVNADGSLSLKNFGTSYWKFVGKDTIITGDYTYPDNMPADAKVGSFTKISDVWYVLTSDESGDVWVEAEVEPKTNDYELVTGWKDNLTPKVVRNDNGIYGIEWFEPSSITVEGLSDSMAVLQTSVSNMQNNVDANNKAIAKLNGDASVEGSVDNKIANVMNNLTDDGKINTFKELVNWAENHNTEVTQFGTDIQTNKDAIAELQEQQKNALTDPTQFATADQGKLADTALQPEDVVAGATNGHLSVDGNDIKVFELQPAKYGTLGGISPDGTSITTNDAGVASVVAVDYTKVTGLTEQMTNYQTGAIDTAKNYANETFIPKANIVASTDVAGDVTAASEEKVVSEKAWMAAMTWKESM